MSLKQLAKAIIPNAMIPGVANVYSVFNFFPVYLQANYLRKIKGLTPRYLGLRMDLINTCNLRCRYCYSLAQPKSPVKIMTIQEFKKIADELFPLASYVNISCAWEPLMVKNFTEYLKIAAGYQVPRLIYTTNGQLFTDEVIESTIDCHVSEVGISIDGATKETYEGIRVNASFDRVINNLKRISELKKIKKTVYPKVEIDYTVFEENSAELPLFIERFHDYFDVIFINHLRERIRNDTCPYQRMTEDSFNRLVTEAEKVAEGKHIGVTSNFAPVITKGQFLCGDSLRYLHISSNGDVQLCTRRIIGNIFQESYGQILGKNAAIFQKMYRGKDDYCKACSS